MSERDGLGAAARGLRQYLLVVAAKLDAPAWFCEVDVPAGAYLALERRLARFPDHETALLWDERDGWSAAVESATGDEVIVLAYLGEDVLPPPEAVVAFVTGLYGEQYPGQPDAPDFRRPGTADGFDERLAAYAGDPVGQA
ncbi:hypothetical protein SAMN04489727_5749 [Amycolatopsis tolypomycina]|uniref:DUF6292 domain-containing protein n=1 Tax=Amycolatopsis tolypomycina TaxID=208445 RepID=A0A1H4WSG3_9PSEU|nr:DUF6292 family protein [Amycolatopsis tolypomycina]SEC95668.1 hypothetical protein SAMN04489727_5749 [Amycolatopsis tolypomycina]